MTKGMIVAYVYLTFKNMALNLLCVTDQGTCPAFFIMCFWEKPSTFLSTCFQLKAAKESIILHQTPQLKRAVKELKHFQRVCYLHLL